MHGAALVHGDLATTVRRLTQTALAIAMVSALRRSSDRSGSGTSGVDLNHEKKQGGEMKDFKKLQEMDRRTRELAGLYAEEKEIV